LIVFDQELKDEESETKKEETLALDTLFTSLKKQLDETKAQ
jgi:hypothetical protein